MPAPFHPKIADDQKPIAEKAHARLADDLMRTVLVSHGVRHNLADGLAAALREDWLVQLTSGQLTPAERRLSFRNCVEEAAKALAALGA